MDSFENQRYGPFDVRSPLGSGPIAEVFAASELTEGRSVALKLVPWLSVPTTGFRERFLQHEERVARLRHPNIVEVHAFGELKDHAYIAMPLLEGGTLARRMSEAPVSFDEAIGYLREMVSALDCAHASGVIHADLTPGNVLMDEAGTCQLTDFGLTRLLEDPMESSVERGDGFGPPVYRSPERWVGSSIDGRADIYSLGVILFEMLTGQVPFLAGTPEAMKRKHIESPIPSALTRNPLLPPQVDAVLSRAMAKNPNDRYRSASEMAHALGGSSASRRRAGKPTGKRREKRAAQPPPPPLDPASPSAPAPHTPHSAPPATPPAVSPSKPAPPVVDPQPRRSTRPWGWIVGTLAVGAVTTTLLLSDRNGGRDPVESVSVEPPRAAPAPRSAGAIDPGVRTGESVAPPAPAPRPEPVQEPEPTPVPVPVPDIEEILRKADAQFERTEYSEPADDNAVLSYLRVLELDPDHAHAAARLRGVSDYFRRRADAEEAAGKRARTLAFLEKALAATPKDAALAARVAALRGGDDGSAAARRGSTTDSLP